MTERTQSAGLTDLYEHVAFLHAKNARHLRKGFTLQSVSPDEILDHLVKEVQELRDEPDDIDEAGDILDCFLHYCVVKGWSLDDLGIAGRRKLDARLTIDE